MVVAIAVRDCLCRTLPLKTRKHRQYLSSAQLPQRRPLTSLVTPVTEQSQGCAACANVKQCAKQFANAKATRSRTVIISFDLSRMGASSNLLWLTALDLTALS